MINFGTISEILKINTITIVSIFLISLLFIIIPENIYVEVGIKKVNEYKWIGAIVVLISAALLLSKLISYLYNKINKYIKENELKNKRIEVLCQLDDEEKACLKMFFDANVNNLTLPYDASSVLGLLNKGVIFNNSNLVTYYNLECRINPEYKKLIDYQTFFCDE